MYLSPTTPTAAQPSPQPNGEQAHAGPSRPPPQHQQQQNQWQPTSPYSPMMQPQQATGYYPAHNGPSWQSPGRIQQGPRYHEYGVPQQQQGMPQGYYQPASGYYPSYQQQQRPQHTQHPHPSQQAMSHLHYHPAQPQYPMPPVQPQPQPPPAPTPAPAESAPTPPPPTSSTPLNPAARGFTFVPRSSPKPTTAPPVDQGPVYASVAHPSSYNPSPIPPHVAMMYSGYPMPMMMGMNPYQQMNPYQYAMPQHYQQPPMLSPVQAHMMPHPVSEMTTATPSAVESITASTPATVVSGESGPVQELEVPRAPKVEEKASPAEAPIKSEPEAEAAAQNVLQAEVPSEKTEALEAKEEEKEIKADPTSAEQPTSPQPAAAPYTYLSHPSPSSYAYLVSPQRPANPASAPAMSFGSRTSMPRKVKEQTTAWKGETSTSQQQKRKPGVGMVFGVGVGKEEKRRVELVFGSVSAEEPSVADSRVEEKPVAKETEVTTEEKKDDKREESPNKAIVQEAKSVNPAALPASAEAAPATASASPAATEDAKPTPATVVQPKPAPAKPSSWAALVRNKAPSSTPSALATSAAGTTVSSSNSDTPLLEAQTLPEAGPSKPNGAAGPTPAAPRPVFNYAAAAASGSTTRTPAEEFARLLSDGIVPDQNGKGKGRERTVTVPRGLINMGNMCFANSVLQVLVFCTPFAQLFEELGKQLKADLARRTPLVEAVILFLREFTVTPSATANGGDNKPLSQQNMGAFLPSNVYDAMKENKRFDSMRRGHQEDAEEFLGFFLNTLHEELLLLHSRTQPSTANGTKAPAVKTSADDEQETREVERPVSPGADGGDGWLEVGKKQKTNVVRSTETRESAITRIFGGKFRSVLRAPGSKDSVTLESYQSLGLDIQHPAVMSITDALRHLHEPEIVQVESEARKEQVDATKQVFIENLPPCLILNLKRHAYDAKEHRLIKNSKPIGYTTDLVVPAEIITPAQRSRQAGKYRLYGVVYHHGAAATGGHYTACVAQGSGWLHLDDESIEPVPVEQVLVTREAAVDGVAGEVGRARRERCACIAFYQRV